MRLKSLEIKGFKSFADKTVVSFDDNITGIVGPNGCGKSNIVDSIRWVIGEQKISHLRSENLDSLVFNGSKTRSASGLAEVSLTFENTKNLLPTEFSTVTVTRNEVLYGLNQQDKFILAIVLVDGDQHEGPYYVTKPFTQEPDWAVISINLDLNELISRASHAIMES